MTEGRTGEAPRARDGVSAAEHAVLDLIDADAVVDLTRALIRCHGENPPGGEADRAAVLVDAARARGLHVDVHEVEAGRPNVRITLPCGAIPAEPGLLLLGHTDVVPVGEGWSHDPFGADVRDSRILGRGATDMLGGLAACLVAMDALGRSGAAASLTGPIELAALVDEEALGIGIRDYVTDPRHLRHRACVVAEPTDLRTVVAARGASYVHLEVTGRSAHAGDPSRGRNAIVGAAAIVTAIERWHEDLAAAAHPLVGPATWNVGTIHGGTGGSVVADRCVIEADRRLLPGEDPRVVLHEVREAVAALDLGARDLGVSVGMSMDMPGFETDPEDPLVQVTQRSVVDAGGPGGPVLGWSAACDGGFVQREAGIPVVAFGPGSVLEQAHRPDESVAIEDLLVAARAYALSALRLLGAAQGPPSAS